MPEFDRSAIAARVRVMSQTSFSKIPQSQLLTDIVSCFDEIDRLQKECDMQISRAVFAKAEQRGYQRGLEKAENICLQLSGHFDIGVAIGAEACLKNIQRLLVEEGFWPVKEQAK